MAALLDLDLGAPIVRRVRIGGREFDMAPRTFGALRRFREASRAAGAPGAEQDAAVLAIVQAVIPGADMAIVDLLDPEGRALGRLLEHWAGQDADDTQALAQDPPPPG